MIWTVLKRLPNVTPMIFDALVDTARNPAMRLTVTRVRKKLAKIAYNAALMIIDAFLNI